MGRRKTMERYKWIKSLDEPQIFLKFAYFKKIHYDLRKDKQWNDSNAQDILLFITLYLVPEANWTKTALVGTCPTWVHLYTVCTFHWWVQFYFQFIKYNNSGFHHQTLVIRKNYAAWIKKGVTFSTPFYL